MRRTLVRDETDMERTLPAQAARSPARQPACLPATRPTGAWLGPFPTCENDRGIPGSGQVDWTGVFSALRDVKYDGWLTIESFVPAIKELAAAAIWRPFAKDGDELARDGLEFIKETAG